MVEGRNNFLILPGKPNLTPEDKKARNRDVAAIPHTSHGRAAVTGGLGHLLFVMSG